jgi:hypothetical protein
MAVDYRGSTVTPPIVGYPNSGEYVFALVNTIRSRHRINILRFIAMGDTIELSTAAGQIMPLLRTWRCSCSQVSGGVEIIKRPAWDTAINSPDPAVKLLYSGYGVSESNRITLSARTGPVWEQFISRQMSSANQVKTQDQSMLSRLTTAKDFVLLPGEAIAVSWEQGTQPVGGSIFLNIAWEEDEYDLGYNVSGTVTLEAVPVTGASVIMVTDSDGALPNPEVEILSTDASGAYTKKLASGIKASVFVQHDIGGTLYTDEGKPYIEKP